MTTTTVYSGANDDSMYYYHATVFQALDTVRTNTISGATLGTRGANAAVLSCGTGYIAGSNGHHLSDMLFMDFTTSSIDDGDTVSAATLSLYITAGSSIADSHSAYAYTGNDWGTTVTTADLITAANLAGNTKVAALALPGTTGQYNSFTSEAAFPGAINKTGITKMTFANSFYVDGGSPTGANYFEIYSADDSGTTRDPKLVVTHAAGGPTTISSYMSVAKASWSTVDSVALANIDKINEAT